MLTRRDASAAESSLVVELPALLAGRGLILKQKRGYKAGKLSASRNWCRIVDGDMYPGVPSRDSRGELKTWRLFARFDAGQSPSWPWDKLEQCEGKKPQGMMSGDDVWGVSYEGLQTWSRAAIGRQIAERLAGDLQISFNYSRQHYC
jgi:hypothetical protein